MNRNRGLRLGLELVVLSVAVGAINLLFPRHPGFITANVNLYLLTSLLVAAYYGRYPGFLTLSLFLIILLGPLPPVLHLIYGVAVVPSQVRSELLQTGLLPFVAALVGVYIFGFIRDSGHSAQDRLLARLKRAIREKVVIGRKAQALEQANRELEERVFRQTDSLTALYSQVQNLRSYDLSKALDALLETIERFSRATSASIWEYLPDEKELRLVAHRGGEGEHRSLTKVPVAKSIEGWVVRNDMMYSVRLLSHYVNLQELDDGRNIITLPIKAGSRVWGVLNIEAMPFARYNLYTERLLEVIMALVSPALEHAVESENTLAEAEPDRHTGLPTYPQFHAILEKDLYRAEVQKGSLSVIILEIANAEDLRTEFGSEKYYTLLVRVVDELRTLTLGKAHLYHYQAEHQLALLYPNLDFDGASLSCLEILSMITSTEWTINEKPVSVDAVVGYASVGDRKQTADELLDSAEHLLEMQKV